MSKRRYECVYKRIADVNEPFCERGEARKRANDFLHKNIEAKRTLLRRGTGVLIGFTHKCRKIKGFRCSNNSLIPKNKIFISEKITIIAS